MNRLSGRSALTLFGAASGTLCAPAIVRAARKRKIAMPLPFPAGGDVGWEYGHIRGAQMALAVHGNEVEIDFFHEISEWGNGEKEVLRQLVPDGYEMIFTTSAGYVKATIEVAVEAPNVLSDLLETMPNRTHRQAKDPVDRLASGQHQAFGGPVGTKTVRAGLRRTKRSAVPIC